MRPTGMTFWTTPRATRDSILIHCDTSVDSPDEVNDERVAPHTTKTKKAPKATKIQVPVPEIVNDEQAHRRRRDWWQLQQTTT